MLPFKTAAVFSCWCLLSSGCNPAGDDPTPAKVIRVELSSLKFEPSTIQASVGDTIVWYNADLVPHTVDEANNNSWQSGQLDPRQEFSLVASLAGRFALKCQYHPGMTGELIVGTND